MVDGRGRSPTERRTNPFGFRWLPEMSSNRASPIVDLDADRVVSVAPETLVVYKPASVAPPADDDQRELDGLEQLIAEWGSIGP